RHSSCCLSFHSNYSSPTPDLHSFPTRRSSDLPTFSNYSHGFRINKSCHTALKYVQKYFTGTKWFVEGDIKGCFDNVDHHVLIAILRKRIADEHFIGLLWKLLKAGYMEDWNYHNTYSGAPQGSIISPILAIIYLNELDNFMAEYAE